MHFLLLSLLLLSQFLNQPTAQANRIVKQNFDFNGKTRTYYVLAPDNSAGEASLVLLLHGSGMNGRTLVEEWSGVAQKERIVVVGPDSSSAAGWSLDNDGRDFIHAVVTVVQSKYSINPRRIYLFGYSAGAVYALQLSLLESDYFAATAVYAGAIDPATYKRIEQAKRKIPIAIFVSTNDPFFPVSKVQATRNELVKHGFPVTLKEVWIDDSVHGHDYHSVAESVNRESWRFLQSQQLPEDSPHKPQ